MIRTTEKLGELQLNLGTISDHDTFIQQSDSLISQYEEFVARWHADLQKRETLQGKRL